MCTERMHTEFHKENQAIPVSFDLTERYIVDAVYYHNADLQLP